MGFLFTRKPPHGLGLDQHGTGASTDGSQVVHPLAARSTSGAFTPSINIAGAQIVSPTVAISSSVAKSPTIMTGGVTVIPTAAHSTSVALGPQINPNIVNNTTGQYILGSNGAIPIWFDRAARYASDSNWRGQIYNGISVLSNNSLKGTHAYPNTWPGSSRYGDGRYVDLVSWVPSPDGSFGPAFNESCFEYTFPGMNQGGETPTAELSAVLTSGAQLLEFWFFRRVAHCSTPKFTSVGNATSTNGINFNVTQNAGFKDGCFGGFLGSGRAGIECGNGQFVGGNPTMGQFGVISNQNSGVTGGLSESNINCPDTGVEFYNGNLYVRAAKIEQWTRVSDNTKWVAITVFQRPDASTTWTQLSDRSVANISTNTKFYELIASSLNYNQSRSTPLKRWVTDVAFFDPNLDSLSQDPCGCLAQANAQTPVNPSAASVTSATTAAVTANVTIGKYTGYVRAKIDGSFLIGKDFALLRETGELQFTNVTTRTNGICTATFSSLGLSAGSHTVQFYAVSRDGNAVSASGPSANINV